MSEKVTTSDLGTLNEMNLDLIDFPAFESQGRVWLLFWQTDDFRSVKQQDCSYQPPHKILTALRSPPPRPPGLPFGDQARGVQCQSEVFRPGQVPGLRGSHGHLRDHCHRSRVENT